MMSRCLRLCLDCADMCPATLIGRFAAEGQFGGAAMRFACLDFLLVHHIVARLGQYAQPR